jgi:hypothetical protein
MPILPLLLAAAGATATGGLAPAGEVALPDRRIRLGDVADLSGLAPAARKALAPRVIAALPGGRSRIALSREALSGLVRRSVPGLVLRLRPGEGPLSFRAGPAEPQPAGSCAGLARPVPAGAALSREDLVPVGCRAGASPGLRFDRLERVVRAQGGLAAGTYLGRISLAAAPAVAKGAKLTLVARAGPVRVTREVVALQAGRAGGRLFVQDSEGHVTSAPLAGAGE